MEQFFIAISNFGFPIAVAGYLLFRFEGKIEGLSNTINKYGNDMTNGMHRFGKQIDRLDTTIKNLIKELKYMRKQNG